MSSSPQALALNIPIIASLSGGGEVPPTAGLMTRTFDTDINT
jgi:hypothetical protein